MSASKHKGPSCVTEGHQLGPFMPSIKKVQRGAVNSEDVAAITDFRKIEKALAGSLDADLLNPVEAEHFLDQIIEEMQNPGEELKRYYADLGCARKPKP